MPPKIRKRLKSAKERIEATSEIARKEMAWYKEKFGELRSAARRRKTDEVSLEPPKPDDRAVVHTHTYP